MINDAYSVVFSFLHEQEVVQVCSMVCTQWFEASSHIRDMYLAKMIYLQENVAMAMEDKHVNEDLARLWLREKVVVNPRFGKAPDLRVGSLCDASDFQGSYGFASIISKKARKISYGSLGPMMVTHRANAERANVSAESSERYKIEVQYLVRFLGWSDRWNEYKSSKTLFPLGSKTMVPTSDGRWDLKETQQWVLVKNEASGQWQVCLLSRMAKFQREVLPLTDVTASLLISRKLPHKRL